MPVQNENVSSGKKLLSITIPTYNRAPYLKKSLQYLLPQLVKHKDDIEIIISDNCCQDDTQEVIKEKIKQFPELNITNYRQNVNTGFMGNFSKCKELATGKFFWLLSDNDYVNEGVMDYIMPILKLEPDISAIHLNGWGIFYKKIWKDNYCHQLLSTEEMMAQASYKLTLISAVIYINNKERDEIILQKFNQNGFIAFASFLESFASHKKSVIINGVTLLTDYVLTGFNPFTTFTAHLMPCLDYAVKRNLITEKDEHNFTNSLIKDITQKHYMKYKLGENIYGKHYGSLQEIEALYEKYFSKYEGYKKYHLSIKNTPKPVLYFQYFLYKAYSYFSVRIQRILHG